MSATRRRAVTILPFALSGDEAIYVAMKRWSVLLGMMIATAAGSALAEPKVIAEFRDWTAFRDDEDGKPVCYMGSKPTDARGNYTRRGDTYLVVAVRRGSPSNGVVNVEAGYPYKSNSTVEVVVDGSKTFSLFTRNRKADGKGDAWADDDAEDRQLVEAMKAGQRLVVKGTSKKGTLTTDIYSLSGFTKAYKAIRDACGG